MKPPIRPPLAGRSVYHAQAQEPWHEGRALCDRMARWMRVGLPGPGRLALVLAPGREVTCRRCLRALAAQARKAP